MASTDRLVSIKADETFPTRVQAAINALIAASSVNAAQVAAINAAVAGVINAAPGALDTLNELAAALGNDANFAATITTALGTKVNSSTYTAGMATKADASALTAEATTARAAELALRNLSDSAFNTALSAAIAAATSVVSVWRPNTAYAKRAAVLNPDGDRVFAKAAFTSGATYDPTKWNYYNLVDDLPAQWICGHRGGAYVYPEETLIGYDLAAASGTHMLEGDCWQMQDGVFAMMHDSTVDRTTTGTGNTNGFTSTGLRALTVDLPPFPTIEHPPLLDELVSKWGGKRVLRLQCSGGILGTAAATAAWYDYLDSRKLRGAVIVEAFDNAGVAEAKARGYHADWVGNTDPSLASVQAAVAAGADFVYIKTATTDANIASYVAAGAKVVVSEVMRRVERDRAFSLGAVGIGTDVPGYLTTSARRGTKDPWRYGSFGHGTISFTATSPALVSGAIQSVSQSQRIYPGDLLPYDLVGTRTINLEMQVTAAPSGSNLLGVDVALTDDTDPSGGAPANGYMFRINAATGDMSLSRGNGTGLGLTPVTVASAPLVVGTWVPITISITSTAITVTRTDTAVSVSRTDATYRGGYMRLVANAGTGLPAWRNLTIT